MRHLVMHERPSGTLLGVPVVVRERLGAVTEERDALVARRLRQLWPDR